MARRTHVTTSINGLPTEFLCEPRQSVLEVLRDELGLTGAKEGCNNGNCGACAVILNGRVVNSCCVLGVELEGAELTTIEGIADGETLHPLQQAFLEEAALQCGICTPGFIVSAKGLLDTNPNPTREEVRDWFQKHRNVCRCTGYKQIVDAVMEAAKVVRGEARIDEIGPSYSTEDGYYGKPLVRPTALAKVCGLADYGDDQELKMPAETLHVAMVQPRVAHHAKILDIDVSEAEKMPGVEKINLAADIRAAGGTNIMAEGQMHERTTVMAPSR